MPKLNKSEETIISTIILAIIIIIIISHFSKIKTLKMLLYTSLGRFILLLILVYITSCNKMLGLLFVLIIILVDNSLENNLYYMENFESKINTMNTVKNSEKFTTVNNSKIARNIPIEGRDLIGLESNLKRGKQSNSLTVHPSMYESVDVLPNEPDYGFKSASSIF